MRTELAARHLHDAVIARKRRRGEPKTPTPQPLRLGLRWTVERTNSWLSNHGQLRRNTDRLARHRLAQLALAIVLVDHHRQADRLARPLEPDLTQPAGQSIEPTSPATFPTAATAPPRQPRCSRRSVRPTQPVDEGLHTPNAPPSGTW